MSERKKAERIVDHRIKIAGGRPAVAFMRKEKGKSLIDIGTPRLFYVPGIGDGSRPSDEKRRRPDDDVSSKDDTSGNDNKDGKIRKLNHSSGSSLGEDQPQGPQLSTHHDSELHTRPGPADRGSLEQDDGYVMHTKDLQSRGVGHFVQALHDGIPGSTPLMIARGDDNGPTLTSVLDSLAKSIRPELTHKDLVYVSVEDVKNMEARQKKLEAKVKELGGNLSEDELEERFEEGRGVDRSRYRGTKLARRGRGGRRGQA